MSTSPDRLQPHPPLRFDDGAVWSPLFDDVFKSRAGAFAESRAVFVDGCDVASRWTGQKGFTVLEIGFGLGVNFLSTLARWREDPSRSERLVFVSIDKHPVAAADLRRALDMLGAVDLGPCARADLDALCVQWPLPLPGLHRLVFARGRVVLLLAFGDCVRMLPRLVLRADAVYLDGFSPARNPDAWAERTIRATARLCRPGARLSTYTAAAAVRRALCDAGFDVRRVAGFGGKRERLEAVRGPLHGAAKRDARAAAGREADAGGSDRRETDAWGADGREAGGLEQPGPPAGGQEREAAAPTDGPPCRDAIVVGAGLAGCAIAVALVARGWRVSLLDAGDRPLPVSAGSAQPWLAEHLHVAVDDNPLARLTRAAWSMAGGAREALSSGAAGPCGMAHVADGTGVADMAGVMDAAGVADMAGAMDAAGVADAVDAAGVGATRRRIGRLIIARDDDERARLHDGLARLGWPSGFLSVVDAETAQRLAGIDGLPAAVWWPGGAIVDPAERCRRWLADAEHASPGALTFIGNCAVARIEGGTDGVGGNGVTRSTDAKDGTDGTRCVPWRAFDGQGRERARASVMVLANAGAAPELAGLSSVELQASAGQSTRLRSVPLSGLRCVIGGDAYVLPVGDGEVLTGATHRIAPAPPAGAAAPIAEGAFEADGDDRANVERLRRWLGGLTGSPREPIEAAEATASIEATDAVDITEAVDSIEAADSVEAVDSIKAVDHHAGWRFATRDHLPVIGPVHDEAAMRVDPGPWQRNDRLAWPLRERLYIACGHGGRGLLWSTLAAELLAAMIADEALPIEADLARAISPDRFLRRRLRRGAR